MKEWYLSTELVGLDGMANSATGVSQKAKRNNWLSRKSASGSRALEYHISNFHPDVKRQVIEKYVTDLDEAEYLLTVSAPSVTSTSVGHVDIGSSQTSQKAASRGSRNTDDNVTEISNVKSVKATSQIGDMCAVPVYNVYASCGFGAQNDTEYQLRTEFLPCLWLKRFGLTEEDARIIICHGDSMEDTLSDGDEVLVDTRELDHPVKHGVYVVRIGKHVYIKRLKYDIMAEGYNVISDNKEEYDSFIVNEEKLNEFAVIGKVITTVMKAVI
ncbi:helix-turn-helix domain-containing protein [Vibrio splendidus]|uniref:helix-turn-helix domain-containing protein n=1 Tax=Vibrio splendidus TaxID=29497 RepID=UPI000C81FA58|nr:S24 family peptidase [Vibrio splendidus]